MYNCIVAILAVSHARSRDGGSERRGEDNLSSMGSGDLQVMHGKGEGPVLVQPVRPVFHHHGFTERPQ